MSKKRRRRHFAPEEKAAILRRHLSDKVPVADLCEVKGNGSILLLEDGSVLEVSDMDTLKTGLWLGMSDALLIDDRQLLNLDKRDEVITVRRIR